MELQAVSDIAQMQALAGALHLFLHGIMLVSTLTFGLIGLLCLSELRPARSLRTAGASAPRRRQRQSLRAATAKPRAAIEASASVAPAPFA